MIYGADIVRPNNCAAADSICVARVSAGVIDGGKGLGHRIILEAAVPTIEGSILADNQVATDAGGCCKGRRWRIETAVIRAIEQKAVMIPTPVKIETNDVVAVDTQGCGAG